MAIVGDGTHYEEAIVPEHAIGGVHLTGIVDGKGSLRSKSAMIRTDSVAEFTGKTMRTWARHQGVALRLIVLDKSVENANVVSFNGRLRDECLRKL